MRWHKWANLYVPMLGGIKASQTPRLLSWGLGPKARTAGLPSSGSSSHEHLLIASSKLFQLFRTTRVKLLQVSFWPCGSMLASETSAAGGRVVRWTKRPPVPWNLLKAARTGGEEHVGRLAHCFLALLLGHCCCGAGWAPSLSPHSFTMHWEQDWGQGGRLQIGAAAREKWKRRVLWSWLN